MASSGTKKTVLRRESTNQFVEQLQHAVCKADADYLISWFEKTTEFPPAIWGTFNA